MALTLTFTPTIQAAETLESGVTFASDTSITHAISDLSLALTGSSSPPVSKIAEGRKAMSGGAGTIDFSAIAGANGATQDMTGLKLRFAIFRNPSTNTGSISIVDGASNGYNIFGDSSGSETLLVGQWLIRYFAGNADAVASGDKTIDIAGTGTESLDYWLVFGS